NSRNAVALQMRGAASPKIVIQAHRLKDYFGIRKRGEAIGEVEAANPYSGLVLVAVEASSAEAIATELASFDSGTCRSELTSDLSDVSLENLGEWLLRIPLSLENYALLQLLQAGKIRGERDGNGGEATMIFRSAGSLGELSAVLRTWHAIDAAVLE